MRGGFRFAPPTVSEGSLLRPRLLALLQDRWQRRLTAVVAGAGFGKTTLLSQAVAENRLTPLGRDWRWVDVVGGGPERGAVSPPVAPVAAVAVVPVATLLAAMVLAIAPGWNAGSRPCR